MIVLVDLVYGVGVTLKKCMVMIELVDYVKFVMQMANLRFMFSKICLVAW